MSFKIQSAIKKTIKTVKKAVKKTSKKLKWRLNFPKRPVRAQDASDLSRAIRYTLQFTDVFFMFLGVFTSIWFLFQSIFDFPSPSGFDFLVHFEIMLFSLFLFGTSYLFFGMAETLMEYPCYPDELVFSRQRIGKLILSGMPFVFVSFLRFTSISQSGRSFLLLLILYIIGCHLLYRAVIFFCDTLFRRLCRAIMEQSALAADPFFNNADIKTINEELIEQVGQYEQLWLQDRFDDVSPGQALDSLPWNPVLMNSELINAFQMANENPDNERTEPESLSELPGLSNLSASEVTSKSTELSTDPPDLNSVTSKTFEFNSDYIEGGDEYGESEDPNEEYFINGNPSERIIQQQNRIIHDGEGERIEGWIDVFPNGGEHRTIHLSFCPPFDRKPEFHLEQISGDPVQTVTSRVFPFGARVEVNRLDPKESEPVRFCYFATVTQE